MKIWRSLRLRLVASYFGLALLLLTFTGYVFSNALSAYAVTVHKAQMPVYVRQASAVIGEARGLNLSADDTLKHLQAEFPDVNIEMETMPPDKLRAIISADGNISPAVLGKLGLPDKPVIRVGIQGPFGTPVPRDGQAPGSESRTAPPEGGLRQTRPSDVLRLAPENSRFFWLYSGEPVQNTFSLPWINDYPQVQYRFTVRTTAGTILSSLYRQVLVVLALALGLAGLVGWLLSRWLSGPFSRLANATEAVAAGDFLQTVGPTGVAELDRLTDQFNRMVLRLRESFRSLAGERDAAKRFAADAAHELKTPVTTLRAYHEVVEEHPERLRQVTPAIGRQIERMEKIITGLVQMANLSEGTGIAIAPGDVCEAIRDLVPVYEALVEEHGHRLTLGGLEGSLPVLMDRRLLELAVNNLMDNACKYSQVSLGLEAAGDDAVITVADSGKGIPPGELPYIFERFHRGVDTQSIPGTGLGLAIVQEAVRRLGGTVTAESEVGVGSRFVIRLPLVRE
ncbi:MAG TPA: HAMP domain-containing sensor histidine kinase [Symbiobacteriaceae bacterium]|jgi:signal transduction histidine kinase